MQYRTLGKTNLTVSAMAVGSWAIGGAGWGAVDEAASIRAIHAMMDAGVNIVDTAPFYGCGESERIVGKAVKQKKAECAIVTKGGVYWDQNGAPVKQGSYRDIVTGCEESLNRLGVDTIDVFLIHWHDEITPLEEVMRAVEDLRKAGKIRFAGASNFDRAMIEECEKYGSFDVLQQPYSMVNRQFETLLQWAHEHAIGTMSYGSLGAGILTGSIRSMPTFEEGDMRLSFYDYFTEPKFSRIMELLKKLDIVAENYSVPLSHVAINWGVQSGFLDTILIGIRDQKEALENCAAFTWQLSKKDMQYINENLEL